jgi:hypothetical protein
VQQAKGKPITDRSRFNMPSFCVNDSTASQLGNQGALAEPITLNLPLAPEKKKMNMLAVNADP